MIHKLGRKPRRYDPRIPHWSSLRRSIALPQAPPSANYVATVPAIGMLGNDQWGDCACAGAIHLLQLQMWNAAGVMPNAGTAQALQLYSEVTGFNESAGPPGSNPTDEGTCLQDLLAYWLKTGVALADGTRHKIVAYFEVDPRNAEDLNLGTAESAGVYLGFNVPADLDESSGATWDVKDPKSPYQGGHCVVSGAYPAPVGNREIESWGETDYAMTPRFWDANVDECYVVIAPDFVNSRGVTPYGITLDTWSAQMSAIRGT